MTTKRLLPVSLSVCLLALSALAQNSSLPKPPDTPKHAVTDEYLGGVKVTDDYRWLENWDDAEVKQWSAAENARDALQNGAKACVPYFFAPTAPRHFPYSSSRWAAESSGFAAEPVP